MNALEEHALQLLQQDSLATAEKIAGPGKDAVGLGVILMQQLSRDKEDALSVLGDTHFRMSYAECVELLERNNTEKVYSERHGEQQDLFEIWWHKDGLLFVSESYGAHVNVLQVYYNWAPRVAIAVACRFTSSGGFYGDDNALFWAGHYDGREGLLLHLKRLRQNGEFLPQWRQQPFLWFLNYSEPKVEGYDYKAINKLKYVVLPAHVQQAIGPIT